MGAVWWKMRVQYVVLGPWLKVIILNILPESRHNELKYSLKIAFMFLSIILKCQVSHINILLGIRKRDRFRWSLYCNSGKQRQKNNVIVSTRKVFSLRFCEYKIICFSFKDFRQQSRRVSRLSVDEQFSARSKTITKISVCSRGIKKGKL